MNKDTVNLLKECNSGCKMATNSMEQMVPFVKNDALKSLIEEYNNRHINLGDQCHNILNHAGEEEKDPQAVAKAFSWLSTEVKLAMNSDDKKIAEILVDGCNMGIKGVSRYKNQYQNASEESVAIAKNLIGMEKEFMDTLLSYV